MFFIVFFIEFFLLGEEAHQIVYFESQSLVIN